MKLQSLIMYSFAWSIYTVINSVTDLECVNVPEIMSKSMKLGFSFPFHFKVPYKAYRKTQKSSVEFWIRFLLDEKDFIAIVMYSKWQPVYGSAYT